MARCCSSAPTQAAGSWRAMARSAVADSEATRSPPASCARCGSRHRPGTRFRQRAIGRRNCSPPHRKRPAPLPPRLVTEAQRLYVDLLASSAPAVLLHGDLHHGNILRHGEDWVAIDPKGVIGEPAYECGPLLFNPLPQVASWPDLPRVLGRRVDILGGRARLRARADHRLGDRAGGAIGRVVVRGSRQRLGASDCDRRGARGNLILTIDERAPSLE